MCLSKTHRDVVAQLGAAKDQSSLLKDLAEHVKQQETINGVETHEAKGVRLADFLSGKTDRLSQKVKEQPCHPALALVVNTEIADDESYNYTFKLYP